VTALRGAWSKKQVLGRFAVLGGTTGAWCLVESQGGRWAIGVGFKRQVKSRMPGAWLSRKWALGIGIRGNCLIVLASAGMGLDA